MRALLAATLLVACTAAPGAEPGLPSPGRIPPGVLATTQLVEYDVAGRTVAEVRSDMRRRGAEAHGGDMPGRASSSIRWTYRYGRSGGLCALDEVRVSVDSRVWMPRWRRPPDADDAVISWWTGFRSRLALHEAQHVRISLETAGAIADALRPMTGASCEELGMRANARGQALLAESRERQARFDRDSRHGAIVSTVEGPLPEVYAGCHVLDPPAWSPPLGADSARWRMPSVLRLDTTAAAGGRGAQMRLVVGTRYGETPPGVPATWELVRDSIRLTLGEPSSPIVVTLARSWQPDRPLEGEATARRDASGRRDALVARAPVVLTRASCAGLRLAP